MTWWAWLLVTFGAFMFGFILAACCSASGANRQCEECAARHDLGEFLAEKAGPVVYVSEYCHMDCKTCATDGDCMTQALRTEAPDVMREMEQATEDERNYQRTVGEGLGLV